MKNKLKSLIVCTVLIVALIIGAVPCYALGSGETDSYINRITGEKASSLGVSGAQGIVDYYAKNSMTLGGEWYVLSFIQNGNRLDYSSYEKNLINYLKNITLYSAVTREKFALVLIALGSTDSFAKKYIQQVSDEAIGKKGVMSYIYGLHLLNNGCSSVLFTKNELVSKIISLQKSDGGWTLSGDRSDVDVTAMALQSLAPYYASNKASIDRAVNMLSARQSSDGDFQSYGVYNAESTAQVIIALSALRIDADSDSRFVKNGKSCLDGLLKYKTGGGFLHSTDGEVNNSASSQAFDAFVSYSRFLRGRGSYYIYANRFTPVSVPTSATSGTVENNEENIASSSAYIPSSAAENVSDSVSNGVTSLSGISNNTEAASTEAVTTSQTETVTDADSTETYVTKIASEENGATSDIETDKHAEIPAYKLIVSAVILALALAVSGIFIILKRRNFKNFIVIFAIAAILITVVLFTNIVPAGSYYNGNGVKVKNPVGTVTLTVRCDTITGKPSAPENPVIIDSTEFEIEQGETVYSVLARASRLKKIPFEHNSNYYVSGIDNLYEYQFGELSGWMYKVNGVLPSVGCNEYVLSDGDEIQWLYTCDIGNDLDD
jgi:hypothetical protein